MALKQGKCPLCKVAFRFSWPCVKDAYCPDCGAKLKQTTHLYQGERRDIGSASTLANAVKKQVERNRCLRLAAGK